MKFNKIFVYFAFLIIMFFVTYKIDVLASTDKCIYYIDMSAGSPFMSVTLQKDSFDNWVVTSFTPKNLYQTKGGYSIEQYFDLSTFANLYSQTNECPKVLSLYDVEMKVAVRDSTDVLYNFAKFISQDDCNAIGDNASFSNQLISQFDPFTSDAGFTTPFRTCGPVFGGDYCSYRCSFAKLDNSNGDDNYGEKIDCDSLRVFLDEMQKYFDILKVIVPILVVALSILDFSKVILNSDSDEMKKAQSKFVKRLILAVVFFLLPHLINFLLNLILETGVFCEV